MCNITPLEVDVAIRRVKFRRKLFDLVTQPLELFRILSALM